MSINPVDAVKGIKKSVKKIGLAKAGNPQMAERAEYLGLVLREILLYLGPHVVRNHCHPVVGLQRAGESVGVGEHVIDKSIVIGGKFQQHYHCHRLLRLREIGDLLGNAVF